MTISSSRRGFVRSVAMQEAVRGLQEALNSSGGVLLCGESGTGREVFARAIHASKYCDYKGSVERLLRSSMQGVPAGRPFVVVDCSTPQNLEERLFGCTATLQELRVNGLDRVREGSELHQASQGTLFLRHTPELPVRVQTRLARVLRDQEVLLETSNGAVSVSPLDFRVVATIDAPVDEARVLPELKTRLAQTTISMPPLRERREDLPALIRYLLADLCAAMSCPTKTVSTQAAALLAALPWRWNLHELGGLLTALVTKVPSRLIRLADVVGNVRLDGGAATTVYGGSLKEARERFERDYVASVLEQHHGRMGEAARALGIQRTNLYRKVRQLSVPRRRLGARV